MDLIIKRKKSSYNKFMAKYKFNSIKELLFTIIVILPLGSAIFYSSMVFLTYFIENNLSLLIYVIFVGILLSIIVKIIIDNIRKKQIKEYENSSFYKECLTTFEVFKRIDKYDLTQNFIYSFLKAEFKSKIQIHKGLNNKTILIVFHTSGIYFCNFFLLNFFGNNFQQYNYLRSPRGLNELKKYSLSKTMIEEKNQTLNQTSILNFSNYLKSQDFNLYSIDENTFNYRLFEDFIDDLKDKLVTQSSKIMVNKAANKFVSKVPEINAESIELAKKQLIEIFEKGYNNKNK